MTAIPQETIELMRHAAHEMREAQQALNKARVGVLDKDFDRVLAHFGQTHDELRLILDEMLDRLAVLRREGVNKEDGL